MSAEDVKVSLVKVSSDEQRPLMNGRKVVVNVCQETVRELPKRTQKCLLFIVKQAIDKT